MDKAMSRKLNLHGMLLQFTFWFGFCTYLAFLIITLIDYGWSASAAAGAMTVMSVIMLVAQPVYGFISDKYFSEKKLSVVLIVASAICLFLLPVSLGSGSNALVWLNMTAITLFGLPIGGLMDSWIVGLSQEFPGVNYGIVRGMGSLAFASSAQIAGMITYAFGHGARFTMGGVFVALSAIVALTFRATRKAPPTGEENNASNEATKLTGKEALKLVFSSKQYCLLLAVSFFLMLSMAAVGVLLQVLILDLDGTTAQIGTATAVMAGSEVPVMFMTGFLLKKFGFKKLFVFASLFYLVRLTLMATATSLGMLIVIQGLQGLSFAIILPVSMGYLSHIVDERVRTTAIAIFGAVTASLTGILGNLITTTTLGLNFTAQNILLIFAGLASLGFVLAVYGAVRKIWDVEVAPASVPMSKEAS